MKKTLLHYNQIHHLPIDYQQRVKDLADFYQQLPYDHDYHESWCDDLDQGFANLSDRNPDWVVVLSLGHCTQNKRMYDQLINECQLLDAPLIGHILDFEDQYPHIHPQIFVVNYQVWKQLGKPAWGYRGGNYNFTSQAYISSSEKFHDAYTPLYIKPAEDQRDYTVKEMQIGAVVIKTMLEAGMLIYNIPNSIRQNKWHLYPDQSWKEFDEFLQGKDYRGTNSSQQEYTSLIGHLTDQVQKQYYVLNTEPLTHISSQTKFDHYAGVASGLKLMCTMTINGFDKDTAVTIFDFSDIALSFQKFLIDQWDGDFSGYQVLCKKFEDANPGHYPCLPSGEWQQSYTYILRQLRLTPAQFKDVWNRYQNLNHRFEKINLYDHQDQLRLTDICKEYKNSYLWISNAFYMEYSLIKLGKTRLKILRQQLLDLVKFLHLVLDTTDHWHQGLIPFNQH